MQKYIGNLILAVSLCTVMIGCGNGGGSNSVTGAAITVPAGTASNLGTVSIAKSALQFNETTTASATFTKADGTPAAGIQVLFTTTNGTLNPANGVVTTDNDGIATISLISGNTSGQGQISASATVDNRQVSKNTLFSVNLPTLQLANLAFVNNALATIDYGSTIGVTVDVTDANGAIYTSPSVDVLFTSTQAASGKATISSPVQTVNGKASATYTALSAVGTDTITATIAGSSKTINLTVNPLNAASISYLSASPTNIALKGMGGAGNQETSRVTFKVVDTSGAVKANQPVTFALSTEVGGISLTSTSGSTSSDGTVSTIVQSGNIAMPVRVVASTTVNGVTISTQSDQLVISTGIPAQDGFSISISNMSPESWNIDGVTTAVTARLSDHFHNPVPDGTAVYFTTSGGSIQPSCLTVGGACSVNWTSQNPRPIMPSSLLGLPSTGALKDGRAVILAYAVGEEAFLDINGNGVADLGEFTDTSEAFRDDNEDDVRQTSTETFIDYNNSGTFNNPDGSYNGILQGVAYTGAAKLKHVYSNSPLVMATSAASITNSCGDTVAVGLGSSTNCTITVSDQNGNTMPSGSTVDFAIATNIQGTTVVVDSTTLYDLSLSSTPFTFPNSAASEGTPISVTISDPSLTTHALGTFTVTVTSPGGMITTRSYSVN